jgi:hypothetical protein
MKNTQQMMSVKNDAGILAEIGSAENPKNDLNIMKSVNSYLAANGLELPDDVVFMWRIDYVTIKYKGYSVLEINLPPVSHYSVDETEHTDIDLKKISSIAS